MKKKLLFVVCCILGLGLVSCDPGALAQVPTGDSTPVFDLFNSTEIVQTPAVLAGESALASVDGAGTALNEGDPELAAPTFTPSAPCNSAAAGHPIDVTIPDDTELKAGETFTKTWRLVNTGSCTWTEDYAIVWFSGDQMGSVTSQKLSQEVTSGQSIDISVELTVPLEGGIKQSFWKLRNGNAEMFGIGPASDAPFWVRIFVIESGDQEPTMPPEPTPTPVVLVEGVIDLMPGESINLDSGEKALTGEGDLILAKSDGTWILLPDSSAILGVAGSIAPSQADCRWINQGADGIVITDLLLGTYFCYQTDHGLPGVARLAGSDETGIRLDFNTWIIP